jgi:surface antigen
MSPMDHAAAHERIEDLLLERARMDAFHRSGSVEDVALREHLAGCPACRADLDAYRTLQGRIAAAMPARADADAALAAVEPIELPPSLRSRVAAAVRSDAGSGEPISIAGPARRRGAAMWLGVAASLVLLFASIGVALDQANRRAIANAEADALATALVAVDRVLAAEHRIVELRGTDGVAAGSISWSRHDWVVLSSALEEPPAGQTYECWLEDGGRSVPVGSMEFAGGTAYWVATLDDWQTWEIGPTTQFVVSLETGAPPSRTGEVVLSADLGS